MENKKLSILCIDGKIEDFENYVESIKDIESLSDVHYIEGNNTLFFTYSNEDFMIVCHNISNAMNFLSAFLMGVSCK